MRFVLGESDSISERAFAAVKWVLSALSVALTSGFVMMLEAFA
ncbi:MAG: hypothetical protein PVI91_04600 [Gammaproteobacteria bacterium]|jgi:hypothetical protein